MKFTIAPDAMLEGLAIASSAAAGRTPKPALQGTLIRADKSSVLLMATDLEMGIRYHLNQVDVQHEGEALVPVAKLSQIVREGKAETIELELQKNTLHIRDRDSHFQIYSGDSSEFPPVPELTVDADFTLTGAQLQRLINRTLFAAAKESTRYAIDGLLWDYRAGQLKVVATDGRRLAMATCTPEGSAADHARAIIPAKAMALVLRVASDPQEVFQIKFLSNQVLLKSLRVTVSSVLVEGHFPKYEDVIPSDCDRKVTVQSGEMLSAVKRSALLTSEESKAIRLHFGPGKLIMTGRAPEQGEASVELPVHYTAEPMEIGFNPVFLTDVLKVVDGEEIDMEFKDPNRPGLFRREGEYLYVVMPVNLS